MTLKHYSFFLLAIGITACNSNSKEIKAKNSSSDLKIVGAMKNVMWNGELDGVIELDTIQNKKGLYGIGPKELLTGEILVIDGSSYVSEVRSDSTMMVTKTFKVSAPFFVYGNITEWNELSLPENIKSIQDLEVFIAGATVTSKRPFAFKLKGQVTEAKIHIQNLPIGTKVTSPEEAHQGQQNYTLKNEAVEIVGFFSTEHKGIFTHHDSFIHTHLMTIDERKMGHLDEVELGEMKLYLPIN